MATATTFKDRFYKLFAGDLTASTFVECLLIADEAEAEIDRLRAALREISNADMSTKGFRMMAQEAIDA